ncbi:carboxyl transferase domain-containing protein [Streptomyces sp. AM8-1-1]|uniref:carboxyl transferase domain-containing protein n=1 Tax=Streptomyces sp. AM8-1-1 TaxID=3075825 RepID=UPI0028C3A902|nr:carboxyl transferase domain-containing protein [Streptomyces sp. AM8-1-1]WNO74718.1 carboxyl transferase domain-containing protein [Streptomyces sp. AM8-1-1]
MADRLSASAAIALICDDFTETAPVERQGALDEQQAPDGPIGWEGYGDQRAAAARRTGSSESVVWGEATVGGRACVVISFEFGFLGGSLSSRAGDRLEAAYDRARELGRPLVSLIATGGSRMQEGMIALTQLQRVAAASVRLRAAGVAQIAVLRDPTTGGGWATLGAGADVILALPSAQVGFAGSRVRPPDADPSAYTAEAQLAAGQIDEIVAPEDLREAVSFWAAASGGAGRARFETDEDRAPLDAAGRGRSDTVEPVGGGAETGAAPSGSVPPPFALGAPPLPRTGWDAVTQARTPGRPHARAYLDAYFGRRRPLSGDRCGGVDAGMLCGVGMHDGRAVAFVAQGGTATLPAGYRTAARVVRMAGRLGLPVLTLIDTPGAANDAAAERSGAGAAIADLFAAIAGARSPVTSLLIGEGGSGGALALAAPGNTWATPDSYFSVIAPELAAAILKRPPEQVPGTADQLRLRPQDLVELGVVRGIVAPRE